MHDSNIDAIDHSNHKLMMTRIAAALDCAVDDFFAFNSSKVAETSALLAFWHSIRDAGDREKVLAYVRTVAGKPPLRDATAGGLT